MKYLLNLSGGIDSVYALYKHLTTKPNETLLVHHCELKTPQNRFEKETEAVKAVLNWHSQKGLTNYVYIKTSFDCRELGIRPLDGQVIAFMNGILFQNKKYRTIKYTYINTPKDEYQRLGTRLLQKQQDSYRLIRSIPQHTFLRTYSHNLQPIYTVKHLSKQQIIEQMPKELVQLSWSCRTPRDNKPCQKCHTCLQLK